MNTTTYLDLVLIALIWAFIIDYAGAVSSLAQRVAPLLRVKAIDREKLKPFSCSLCMTFWTGIAYLLIVGEMSLLNLGAVCVAAALTMPLYYALRLATDTLNAVISLLNKWIDKLY